MLQPEPEAFSSVVNAGCRFMRPAMDLIAATDDSPRVKFLCSFGGSILPRPLDGRLRYVGGETRIVTVPRDVSFVDLLARVREIFDGVSVIKYQQPDEDLDALVSVVNDEDVMNMMEEYDKLIASGEGPTWLRIFLFSQYPDQDAATVGAHFDADEREAERRYIDAINSLVDAKPSSSPPDTIEQYFGLVNIDGGIHNQVNLRQLTIPSHGQRYAEMEAPRSPAFFSPGRHAANDTLEFPPSPSSSRFHLGAGEFSDRHPEEHARKAVGHQLHQYDHQSPPSVESLLWVPAGAVVQEKSGFPTNLGHSHNMIEGSNVCEHCQMAFQRNHGIPDARFHDARWKHAPPYMEQPNMVNEYVGHFPNTCTEYSGNRDSCMVNRDMKAGHGIYVKEQNEQHPMYNDSHGYERGWPMHNHPVTHRLEDMRVLHNGNGRLNEHYTVDGNMMNAPFAHGNINDEQSFNSNCVGHNDTHYIRHGANIGNEVFLPQHTVGTVQGANVTGFEDSVRYRNQPSAHAAESFHQGANSLHPLQSFWRNRQVPHPGTLYELSSAMMPNGVPDPGPVRYKHEGSPRFPYVPVEEEIQNSVTHRMFGFEESTAADYSCNYGVTINPNNSCLDSIPSLAPVSPGKRHKAPSELVVPLVLPPSHPVDSELVVPCVTEANQPTVSVPTIQIQATREKNLTVLVQEGKHETPKDPVTDNILSPNSRQHTGFDSRELQLPSVEGETFKFVHGDTNVAPGDGDISEENFVYLPELIASVTKAVLEGAEEVVAMAQSISESDVSSAIPNQKEPLCEHGPENVNTYVQAETKGNIEQEKLCKTESMIAEAGDLAKGLQTANVDQQHSEGNSEQEKLCKIEPTTAEAEALAKGLQTIKNDDLEEIRELGSGTFGSVYYGKWRGSDVAIKRIKASCFTGRPSERERLIADFWKEALIMSCLHHPNIVSFYGVVRDGPDGSLATVTEFMVNGSLKQFLQKKDRTIDRRKRLIIAMDVAFGMEYLHGKNIVHFDLKCENLLVNMRDPHRPVCKIGDLGLSKVKKQTMVSGGLRGTLPWMAPELLSGKSNMVSEKIDVYSYGIVMWELLTGEEPYADMRCASIIGGIVNNTIRPKIPTWCDPEWKSLMESCWSSDPALRPSFSEISQKLRKMAAAINLK